MADVTETQLPGVGVRYEFTTESGQQVGVISHRGGRREVVVYDPDDPDVCSTVMHLSPDDTRTMAELLGATRVSEVLSAVQHEIEGLSIDWLRVPAGSSFAGRTIADGMFRSRTGVSIVAVIRHAQTFPSPDPSFRFEADDLAVAVGTTAGLDEVRAILAS
jgi:TrkA domain protein